MRLYDEDKKLSGWKSPSGDTSQDWQNRFIDWVIIKYVNTKWFVRRMITIFTQPL